MCSTSSHQSTATIPDKGNNRGIVDNKNSSGIGINEDGISDADLLSFFADKSSGNGHGHGIGIDEDGISDADLLSFFEDKSSTGIAINDRVDDPPNHLPVKNEKRKTKKTKTSKSRTRASSSKAGHSSGIKIPKVDASHYFARLPAELRDKIFNELVDDHDSFQAMASVSKQMYRIVGPYLNAKRKKIFDELCTNSEAIVRCRELLDKEEKFLKRVLRTNEELTCRANNLPVGNDGNGNPKNAFFVLGMLGIEAGEHAPGKLPRALQLLELARKHCHKFGRHIDNKLDMDSKIDQIAERHGLNEESAEGLEAAFARHLLKNFVHRYPVLSVFTDVYWPEQMPEKARREMAMKYAKDQTCMGPKKRRFIRQNRGRMYDMCTRGWVEGPPSMTKRARMHEDEVYHHDDYMSLYEFMNGGWRNYPNLPRDDYYEDEENDLALYWGDVWVMEF